MVNALMSLGADSSAQTSFRYTALHLSCMRGSVECIEAILSKDESTVNCQDNEFNTAMHFACRFGYESIVERLLLANADLSLRNQFGNTAAEETTNFDVMKRLKERRKSEGDSSILTTTDEQNLYGRTVLHNHILKNSR